MCDNLTPRAGRSPVKETHHSQKTISLVTTPPSSQPLPASAAREHIALAQLLATLLGPQYDDQVKHTHIHIHVSKRCGRKEERSKQGPTNKAKQHNTPKAVAFPK